MINQAGFLLEVLLLSAAISILIKYIGSSGSIPATPIAALIAVFMPTIAMAIALLWRQQQQTK